MSSISKDIEFVKGILPDHYEVKESKKLGSIHCKSAIGIRLPAFKSKAMGHMITDAEDEVKWDKIMDSLKYYFGGRFLEVFHNTCFCHADFTIYLKAE